jgi:hypothetical protein
MVALELDRLASSTVMGGGDGGCRIRALSVIPYVRIRMRLNSTGKELTCVAVASEC